MDGHEASRIVSILLTADNGCRACTHILIEQFISEFPEFKELAIQAWEKEFQEEFENFNL
jgi:hypothetical protein